MRLNLIPHPSTPCESISTFEVFVGTDANALTLRYRILGETDEILLPKRRSPERRDELWQHTCFELFARSTSGSRYCELNFSPSTCWAAYEFGGLRTGIRNLPYPETPQIHLTCEPGCLSMAVDVNYRAIAANTRDTLRIALAAVLERRDGCKSYWALAHPAPTPDFHHPDAFTLAMPSGVAR